MSGMRTSGNALPEQRDLVLLSYPFSDLSGSKVRPAIIISKGTYNRTQRDVIVVPLTTNLAFRDYAFVLTQRDLERGILIRESAVKCDRVFSIEKGIIRMNIGKVKPHVHKKITDILWELVRRE